MARFAVAHRDLAQIPLSFARLLSRSLGGARRLLGHGAIRCRSSRLGSNPSLVRQTSLSLVGRRETASRAWRDSLSLIATWLKSLSRSPDFSLARWAARDRF